jgi:hypothetical protein
LTFNINLTEFAIELTEAKNTTVDFTLLIAPVNPNFAGIIIKYKKETDSAWSIANFPAPIANDVLTISGLDMETKYQYYIVAFDGSTDLSDIKTFSCFTTTSTNTPNQDPMALRILENIVTTLQAMQSSSKFVTEFADVELDRDGAFQVENYPSAIVSSVHNEKTDKRAIGYQTNFMDVMLDLHFETDDNFEVEAQNLLADVEDALLQDVTRGGLAHDTTVMQTDTFHVTSEGSPKGLAIIMVQTQFKNIIGNSRLGRDC